MTKSLIRYILVVYFATSSLSGVLAIRSLARSPTSNGGKIQKITVADIHKLTKQLSHPRFRVREVAAQKLRTGGLAAAEALLKVKTDELEVRLRVVELLRHLLKEHHPSDEGIPLKTLIALAREESRVVHGWALKALKNRCDRGSDEAKDKLQQICKSTNKQNAQLAVNLMYPLPTDRKTKRLVDIIASYEKRIESYRRQIEKIKKRQDLGELSKMIDISGYQRDIRHNERELRFFQAELLKRRMEVQEKR